MPRTKSLIGFLAIALALGTPAFGAMAQTHATNQAQELSKKEVKLLIANARTSEDHERLAAYFRAEGEHLKSEQQEHREMLDAYLKNPTSHPIPRWPTLGVHCRDLVFYYGKAAEQAFALADLHDQMAKEASSGK